MTAVVLVVLILLVDEKGWMRWTGSVVGHWDGKKVGSNQVDPFSIRYLCNKEMVLVPRR